MRRWLLCCTVLLTACEGVVTDVLPLPDGGVGLDAGTDADAGFDTDGGIDPDGGATLDAGTSTDAGTTDAGTTDAGTTDAGTTDAGTTDAGSTDAGTTVDAGTTDAGTPTGGLDGGPSSTRHTAYLSGATDAGNAYWEYLPPGYGDGTLRPLLVFWHGLGENDTGGDPATELAKVLRQGPPKLINENQWPDARPFIVLSPQHRAGGCPSSNEVRDFITWASQRYAVDPKRLYLTGLSCGAIGSWAYLGDHLDQAIVAAVLIAGDPGDPSQAWSVWGRHQCNLGRVALWSFHGALDDTVYPNNNRETMNRLIACTTRADARYVEFPGVGHFSWPQVYDLTSGHDIYAWLLQQAKP